MLWVIVSGTHGECNSNIGFIHPTQPHLPYENAWDGQKNAIYIGFVPLVLTILLHEQRIKAPRVWVIDDGGA